MVNTISHIATCKSAHKNVDWRVMCKNSFVLTQQIGSNIRIIGNKS